MRCPLVSIVVPVFNADQYIERCVGSVSCQTYSNWELLLINDGSTDSSLSVCTSIAVKDSRIRVFDKPNTGVSDTRNLGLKEIRGEYVIFLDADDFWLHNSVLDLFVFAALKDNVDILRGEYLAVDIEGNALYSSPIKRDQTDRVVDSVFFLNNIIGGEFFLPLLFIKAEVIKQYEFEVGRIFLEDMLIISQMLLNKLRCKYLADLMFYAYRKISSSASHKVDFRMLRDAFTMCFKYEELSYLTNDVLLRQAFQHYRDSIYLSTMRTLSSDDYYVMKDKVFEKMDIEAFQNKMDKANILALISPRSLLYLLRFRYKLSSMKHKIKSFCKYV